MYSTSYTGRLNLADWTLLWTDHLAILFLPVVFLHFCLSFPERRLAGRAAWLVPARLHAGAGAGGGGVASQVLFVDHRRAARCSGASPPPSTAGSRSTSPSCSPLSFGVLLDSYRKTRSLTARKQMKWLVWGTGAGVLPFFLFYAIPFAPGPRAAAGHGAGRLHPARPHPALAGLRGGEAPADGRGADLPAHARLHPGHRRHHRHLPARREPVRASLLAGDEEPHVTIIAVLSHPAGDPALHAR